MKAQSLGVKGKHTWRQYSRTGSPTTTTGTITSPGASTNVHTVTCDTTLDGDPKRKADNPFFYSITDSTGLSGETHSYIYESSGQKRLNSQYDRWGQLEGYSPPHPQTFGIGEAAAPSTIQVVRNAAIDKLYSKLSAGNLDLGSSLAEARAASSSASTRVERVHRHGVRGSKPVFPRGVPLGLLKVGSSAWLAWQYAIKPAISDAYAASQYMLKTPEILVCKAGAESQFHKTFVRRPPGSSYVGFNWVHDCDWEFSVKFKVRYTVANVELANFASVTSLNPLLIAWNTVPLSFVVDWFVDIGGYMESMEASLGLGLNVMSVAESQFSFNRERQHAIGRVQPYSFAWDDYDVKRTRTLTDFHRLVGTSLPRKSLSVHLRESLSLGSSRLLSAAALLSTLIKGK